MNILAIIDQKRVYIQKGQCINIFHVGIITPPVGKLDVLAFEVQMHGLASLLARIVVRCMA